LIISAVYFTGIILKTSPLKTKIPPKNTNPPPPPPKNTKISHGFPPKIIQKRPQKLQFGLYFHFLGPFVMFGVFLYYLGSFLYYLGGIFVFFRGKTVGPFLYFLGEVLSFLGRKKWGQFCIFWGDFCHFLGFFLFLVGSFLILSILQ
jgi:hypothetical protein